MCRAHRELARQHPATGQRGGEYLEYRGLVEVAGKGLLAGLVPVQRTARISADGAAQKCPSQQCALGNAPPARLGADLVQAEQRESPQIDKRECGDDVGGSEEGG